MKISSAQFLNQPKKAITVIGMSGLGKTHISCFLSQNGWTHYSCDEVIGRDYLSGFLDKPVTKKDLSSLSRFIGKLGDQRKGGLPIVEFKRRQKLYYDAECDALRQVQDELMRSPGHFINDSTGSLCEIEDAALIEQLGQKTVFVYIRASDDDETRILERAAIHPKPLFFPPAQFDAWLEEYTKLEQIARVGDLDPDAFARWVFPVLFKSRLPKYQRLADLYGVTIEADDLKSVETGEDFIDLIAKALPQ